MTARSDSATAPDYQNAERCAGTPLGAAPRGPVAPTDTDAAAARLAYVLAHDAPDGAPLPWLADRVFRGEPDRADRQWLRREAERQGHGVERPTATVAVPTGDGFENRESNPGYTWIFPRWEHCLTGSDDAGPTLDNSSGRSRQRPSRASENAARAVARRTQLADSGEWSALVGALAAKRVGEERGESERTRFNDRSRALRGADAAARAFAGAAALGHREGAVITATTDPSRYESIEAATEDLLADATALRRKVGRMTDSDGRPPGFTAAEPTSTGLPHVHVAVFGVDGEDLAAEVDALRSYWLGRGRGHQVQVQPIRRVGPSVADPLAWRWANAGPPTPASDRAGCPPAVYLAAGPRALARVAGCDADDLRGLAAAHRSSDEAAEAAVDGRAAEAVRTAAWYFATGLKAATRASPALREAAPQTSASDILCGSRDGTARTAGVSGDGQRAGRECPSAARRQRAPPAAPLAIDRPPPDAFTWGRADAGAFTKPSHG